MNALLETFFNSLSEGVVLVSADGVVRYANRAAQPHLALKVGERVRNTALVSAITATREAQDAPPQRLELAACPGFARQGPLTVQVMMSPSGQQVMLLLCAKESARSQHDAARAMGELINQHCRSPMQNFFATAELAVEALQARNPADTEIRRVVERAIGQGKSAVNKLSQLLAIAQAAEGAPMKMDDRLPVAALLDQATHAARQLSEPRHMRIFLEGHESELPAIYGSRQWLERSIYELIACALMCGSNGADVLVSVAAAGGQVVIAARVAGSSADLPGRDDTYTPFYSEAETEGLYARSLGIGLSFARWVIERHGGRLTVNDDDNGIAEFAATLPCGLPVEDRNFDSVGQAARYAEDLGRLMAERRAQTQTISVEECAP